RRKPSAFPSPSVFIRENPWRNLPSDRALRENPRSMPKLLRLSLFIVMFAFVSGFAECYKPVTKNQLPARIKTVAVPAFQMESSALRYKLAARLADAVIREDVQRGGGL